MTKQYISTLKKNDDIHEDGVTFLQRPDGYWAVPGPGYYIKNRNHAVKAAQNLAKSNPNVQTKLSDLINKTVSRLDGASSDTSIMGA
jgi:hypothetical protein